jgi:hypothetical protein
MIEPIPGWGWEIRATGIHLTPPYGDPPGSIRYVERVRPLVPIRDLVVSLCEAQGFTGMEVSPPQGLVTAEGEYAAIVSCAAAFRGMPVERTIGCVFVDDFYALVDGVALDRARADVIRETVLALVLHDQHRFHERMRRFLYRSPPGWKGLLIPPYHSLWFVPDCRRGGGMLSVMPAIPEAADLVAAKLLLSAGAPESYDLERGVSASGRDGLIGRFYEAETPSRSIGVVVLADERYAYPILLETKPGREARHRELLLELARSVEPIPRPSERGGVRPTMFTMWSE